MQEQLWRSAFRARLHKSRPPGLGFPTRHLVVSGLYRYVRNPMYLAVVSLILGQGLVFGPRVLEYGIAVWTAFYLLVLVYEEPTLRNTFGSEYEDFCTNVVDGFLVCGLGVRTRKIGEP